MKKRLIFVFFLIAYCAILIKVMVFKDIPTVRLGQLMLNFAGTDTGHAPNFVPFVTIVPYLFGYKGLIIAGVNLAGNIVLLIPIGFLIPFVYRNITWKKSLALAIASGLSIEVMQVVLQVGIFDIDDVILNAFGVMIGYWTFVFLRKWIHEKKYMHILTAVIIVISAAAFAFYIIYPWGQPVNQPRIGAVLPDRFDTDEGQLPQGEDLCGGTGGIGQIVSVGDNTFTIKRNDGNNQIVNLTDQTIIETPPESASDLKIGDRVTLVGGPTQDGSFDADTVVVCSGSSIETEER